jgi:transposase
MHVQLPHEHYCAWREHAMELERRIAEIAEIAARQQSLLAEQAELLARREAHDAEQRARMLELESQVAKLERELVGPKSEKIKIPPHERDREDESDEDKERRRAEAEKKRRERALAKDAALATDDIDVPIPDPLKACPTCGGTEHDELPDEVTTRIEYVAGHFVKRRHRREKIVRKCGCPETSIVVAPAPPAPIAGGLYGASFIAFLVVEKCLDSMPIYRIEKRFARLGIPISRSTMNDLVLAAAERLRPLFARLAVRMRAVAIVLADETSMRLQDREKRGYVWVFHGHDDASGGQLVLYVFALDRSGETPKTILGASQGTLVVDGYTGYNVVSDPTGRERGGCMCHGRRKFFEARTSAPDEAEHAIERMRQLFRVEAEAKIRGIVGTDEHLALRRERSKPIVDEIFEWITETKPKVLPQGPIGKAMQYMLNQRRRLELFLSDARVPLHNNESEARLRIIALLRKNSLFFGNPRAGKLWAGLFSLVGGAVANGHEPVAYLADVLLRVREDMSDHELDALLPDRWSPAS